MIPKIRAWSKKFKRMYEVTLIDYENGDVGLKDDHGGVAIGDIKQLILMQSTGLKDKNGVEIFEGDVVKLKYTITSDFELFEVRQFKGGMWRIDNRRRGSDLWLRNEGCEVIGNIYQNSELLESVDE
ncbi:YopX family protein [Streptococcus agalactiae]|uniref:YopX family protein n=1 Tax=Streptococcus agalactiae TaxID=1311 RepID=UPI000F8E767E|nr:YopX family protein [Streptococcus agalactiae]